MGEKHGLRLLEFNAAMHRVHVERERRKADKAVAAARRTRLGLQLTATDEECAKEDGMSPGELAA